jgi:prepilin-type processing-associated H-X9-DG protein
MQSPRTKPVSAFSRIDLLLTIASVLLVLVVLLPAFAITRARSSRLGCTNNLKEVGLAFRTFAIDNDDRFPMHVATNNGGTMELIASGRVFPHFLVMSNELRTPRKLVCPWDNTRTSMTSFARGLADTNLSYFINVDTVETNGASLLCGDRNLTSKAPPSSRFVCLSNTSVIGWNREIHRKKGNLCFADGNVNGFLNGVAGLAVRLPVGVTNRLAVP